MQTSEQKLRDEMIAAFGAKTIRCGEELAPYLTDWRGRYTGNALAVALPDTTSMAAQIVGFCRDHSIAVHPQGGNTGLCAGGVPSKDLNRGIILSAARLRRIREMDAIGDVAIVEAGVPLSEVHKVASEAGRVFPLRLGSEGTAQIGGLISTNAGGTGAVRYGVMRDLVLGIEAVLPDGRILSRLGGLRKDNRGYDWKHLLIGAEGSLGFITAAALKLFPAVRDQAHAACVVRDPAAAVALFGRMRRRFDTAIHAFELISGNEINLALRHIPGLHAPFDPMPEWVLMIELGNSDPDGDLQNRLSSFLETMFDDKMILDAVIPNSARQADELWAVRHSLSEANKINGYGIVFDIAVRVSRVPEFIADSAELVRQIAPLAEPMFVCHLGDGNVHLIAMIPRAEIPPEDQLNTLVSRLQDAVHDLAETLGGSFSAEHGIGRKLAEELTQRLPAAEHDLMQRIKQAVDPENLFARGVLLPTPSENR